MSSGQAGKATALKCLRDTVVHEGVLAVYKGVVPPLVLTAVIAFAQAAWGFGDEEAA